MILTALFTARAPERKRDEIFIGFFVLLMVAAWVVGEWLVPAIADRPVSTWLPFLLVGIFVVILVVSAVLSVRTPGPLAWAGVRDDSRREAEVAAIDVILWFLLLVAGIEAMRSVVL